MDLIYIGKSSFLLKTSIGRKILIDPIKPNKKALPYLSNISLSTVSHNHIDIAEACLDKNYCKIIKPYERFSDNNISICGFKTFHDDLNGEKRGYNSIFLYEVDGLRLCHTGHLGCIPISGILDVLTDIDVLFIPIGGNITINSKDAARICSLINPKIIIPMCYKNSSSFIHMDSVSSFLNIMKHWYIKCEHSLTLKSPLNEKKSIIVLKPLMDL